MMKRGPKTESGKEAVRLNAAKHAILSLSPVIQGLENEADWLAHRDGIIDSLQPKGYLELALVERVALNLWRLNRVSRFESEVVAINQDKIDEDLVVRPGFGVTDLVEAASIGDRMKDLQEEIALRLDAETALKAFIELEDDAEVTENMAAKILYILALFVDVAVKDLDYLPRGNTTAFEVRKAIEVLGVGHFGTESQFVRSCLRIQSISKFDMQLELDALVKRRQQACSWRLLPDQETLAKIQRYEAHLHRQMLQTMHELEALQSRRQGEPTPLAKIDVQGRPED